MVRTVVNNAFELQPALSLFCLQVSFSSYVVLTASSDVLAQVNGTSQVFLLNIFTRSLTPRVEFREFSSASSEPIPFTSSLIFS